MHPQQFEMFQNLLQKRQYQVLEQKALKAIKEDRHHYQLWVFLAQALAEQSYIQDAYEILQRVRLVDPMATWIADQLNEFETLLKTSKPKKQKFDELISLKNATVAVAMIVKNERLNTERWYNSIKGAVDEIVIVDTGSTDGTKEYIETLPDVKVAYFEWNKSMADARNAALPHIESDWVLWMDADEYLEERDRQLESVRFIARYFESFEQRPILKIVQMNIMGNNVIPYFDQSRMFSMKDDLHYIGRMHEQVTKKGQNMYFPIARANSGIRLMHDGYEKDVMEGKDKLERNIEMIRLSSEEEPDNPLWWSYLGRETRMVGRLDEALHYLLKAEEKAHSEPNFGRLLEIYDNMIMIYFTNDDYDNIETVAQKMLAIDPQYPNALYYLNTCKVQKGVTYLKQALEAIDETKDAFKHYRGNVTPDESILHWKADLLKADILRLNGDLANARNVYNKVQESYPSEGIQGQLNFIQQQQYSLIEESLDLLIQSTILANPSIDPNKVMLANGNVLKAHFVQQDNEVNATLEVNSRTKDKKAQQLAEKYGDAIVQLYPTLSLNMRVIRNNVEILQLSYQK